MGARQSSLFRSMSPPYLHSWRKDTKFISFASVGSVTIGMEENLARIVRGRMPWLILEKCSANSAGLFAFAFDKSTKRALILFIKIIKGSHRRYRADERERVSVCVGSAPHHGGP